MHIYAQHTHTSMHACKSHIQDTHTHHTHTHHTHTHTHTEDVKRLTGFNVDILHPLRDGRLLRLVHVVGQDDGLGQQTRGAARLHPPHLHHVARVGSHLRGGTHTHRSCRQVHVRHTWHTDICQAYMAYRYMSGIHGIQIHVRHTWHTDTRQAYMAYRYMSGLHGIRIHVRHTWHTGICQAYMAYRYMSGGQKIVFQ